ncbi:succinylglutamate desuccinylase/aspartoacylase family protein [Paucibacter sp. B2R-40]|uniref:succinylglutamate desuccinylase/aspartoacylase family protein n=1 Tax=Paucibacter sp. B2R-40 TaxID=2893554 RepID=UPI0021E50F89|nr:succinylglutamate desuccinylase/aspartoacylase family protein [Paucibacter sp. B2R-40]MCV2356628.1 succinylglutamate desuccinylase/aspartoacylase family protein [Paucibacter sp. B2R-40]
MSTQTHPTHLRIHQYAGLKPGPKLLVTAAVHGNETCGVEAIEEVMAALDSGALNLLRGTLSLLPIANPLAHQMGRREGERNLNRNLRPAVIAQDFEDRIAARLCPLMAEHDVLLDLHSFQSQGQAFVMLGPPDNVGDIEPFAHARAEAALATCLGPTRIVEGWLSTYELGLRRRAANKQGAPAPRQDLTLDPHYGVGTTEYMRSQGGYGVTLECGQHLDPQAREVARLAILRSMALLGLIAPEAAAAHQPGQPAEVLQLYEVIDRQHPDDRFEQAWTSFDAVSKGQKIGTRHDGSAVLAPADGRIVFPNSKALTGQEWLYLARPSPRDLNA